MAVLAHTNSCFGKEHIISALHEFIIQTAPEPAHSHFTSVPALERFHINTFSLNRKDEKNASQMKGFGKSHSSLQFFVDSLLCLSTLGSFEKHKQVVCIMPTTSSRRKELLFHRAALMTWLAVDDLSLARPGPYSRDYEQIKVFPCRSVHSYPYQLSKAETYTRSNYHPAASPNLQGESLTWRERATVAKGERDRERGRLTILH